HNIKDTAVVVTRYFGGIKLGAGGLIRAYSSTTSQAIKTTGIVKRQLMQGFSVIVEYPLLGKLENALRNSEYILRDIHYLDKVDIHIYVEDGQENTFRKWITELTSAQAEIKETDKKYLEIDVSSTKNEAE